MRTNEELNRIIAQWCGWKPTRGDFEAQKAWDDIAGELVSIRPPDYCNDLNAIHEAEKRIAKSHKMKYALALSGGRYDDPDVTWIVVNATARQRAEALVKVIEHNQ